MFKKNDSSWQSTLLKIMMIGSMMTYVSREYALKIHTSRNVPLPSNSVQTPQLQIHHKKNMPTVEPMMMNMFILSKRFLLNWNPSYWYARIERMNHTTKITFANHNDSCFSCFNSSQPLNGWRQR